MFTCNLCNHNFSSKQCLTYHKSNNACKKKQNKCRYCNKYFSSNSTMYRHMRLVCKVKKEYDTNKDNIYKTLLELKQKTEKLENENKELKNTVNQINPFYICNVQIYYSLIKLK